MPPSPAIFSVGTAHARRIVLALGMLLPALGLVCCDSSDPGEIPLSMYENDAAAAVVTTLMRTVPDPNPGVPKSWSVVLGEIRKDGYFTPASVEFLRRFKSDGRRLVSANVLEQAEPDHQIIDPELRVAVYLLQIRRMRQRSPDIYDVEAAWSYKNHFQRISFEATKDPQGNWSAKPIVVLDGNWGEKKP